MGMTVTLRDSSNPCYYKEYMFKLLDTFPQIDEILICSGYYQENKPYTDVNGNRGISNYRATMDADSNHNNMLRRFPGLARVTTVGIKDDFNGDWGISYQNFVANLREYMGADRVSAYYDNENKWHAKEMIMLANGRAVAGIIGSSNITQPAYGITYNGGYNIESDTFIYDSDYNVEMEQFAVALREGDDDVFIIVGQNNAAVTGGSETAILDRQYRKIMGMLQDQVRFTAF